ncbi:MAG TPA: DUF1559 domain-containing protein [Armatimonadota bacterium]
MDDQQQRQTREWIDQMGAQGYTTEEIREQLRGSAWTDAQIEELLGPPAAPAEAPVVPPPLEGPPLVAPEPTMEQPPPVPVGAAGTPHLEAHPVTASAPASGLAVAALVLGIVSLVIFPLAPLTAPLAVILGVVALSRRESGRGMALAGAIIGVVMVLALVLVVLSFAYFRSEVKANPAITNSIGTPLPSGDEKRGPGASTPGSPAGLAATFERAREKAVQASCLSNLKQLQLGMLMYASDNADHFPASQKGNDGWRGAIYPYVKNEQIYQCPADSSRPSGKALPGSYTMYGSRSGVKTSSLEKPNEAYTLFDGTALAGDESVAAFRHAGGLNLSYADGHVKWLSEAAFKHSN